MLFAMQSMSDAMQTAKRWALAMAKDYSTVRFHVVCDATGVL
jgi:hypothetical protein